MSAPCASTSPRCSSTCGRGSSSTRRRPRPPADDRGGRAGAAPARFCARRGGSATVQRLGGLASRVARGAAAASAAAGSGARPRLVPRRDLPAPAARVVPRLVAADRRRGRAVTDARDDDPGADPIGARRRTGRRRRSPIPRDYRRTSPRRASTSSSGSPSASPTTAPRWSGRSRATSRRSSPAIVAGWGAPRSSCPAGLPTAWTAAAAGSVERVARRSAARPRRRSTRVDGDDQRAAPSPSPRPARSCSTAGPARAGAR